MSDQTYPPDLSAAQAIRLSGTAFRYASAPNRMSDVDDAFGKAGHMVSRFAIAHPEGPSHAARALTEADLVGPDDVRVLALQQDVSAARPPAALTERAAEIRKSATTRECRVRAAALEAQIGRGRMPPARAAEDFERMAMSMARTDREVAGIAATGLAESVHAARSDGARTRGRASDRDVTR